MKNPDSFWRRFWPVGFWYLLLLGQSSIPPSDIPSNLPEGTDKVIHLLIYAPMGWLLKRGGVGWNAVIATAMLLAAADECYQAFLSGRTGDWRDWLADMIGVALGAGMRIYYCRKRT